MEPQVGPTYHSDPNNEKGVMRKTFYFGTSAYGAFLDLAGHQVVCIRCSYFVPTIYYLEGLGHVENTSSSEERIHRMACNYVIAGGGNVEQ